MLLMGDSGAGKSLYTQGLVNKLWQNFSALSPIAIWLSLPSLKDPVNKAVEETLEKYGFNKDQVEELRKTRSFLFILDAYDEIRCEKNLYQTNNLDQWNSKIIFTCRREYLYYKDNYKLFFAPFIGDKIQYTQYEEVYIKPFNANQIQTYVNQYIKTQAKDWKEPEKYQKAIEEITGLKELIKTPFMLKLTMEVLPQIVEKYATQNIQETQNVTQAALYDVFIEQWFIRQEQKLKQAKQIKEDDDIKPEFWAYANELALAMHKANLTHIIYNPNEESDLFGADVKENSWAKFFTPKNPRIEILRTACLVREINQNHFAFVHTSLIEYFLTRNLYERIISQNLIIQTNAVSNIITEENKQVKLEALANPAAVSSTSAPSKQITQSNQNNTNTKPDYFNEHLIVKEDNILQFLADRILEQESFKKILFERVYSSRNNSQNKIAAANAITILNRAKITFSDFDLSGIQIPNADLSYSIMDSTNLSDADLTEVNFRQAYLFGSNLSQCQMQGINFGEKLLLQCNGINASSYSKDGHYLAIGSSSKIYIWDLLSERQYAVFENKTNVSSLSFHPSNKILASTSEKSIYLWNIDTHQIMNELVHPIKVENTSSRVYGGDLLNSIIFSHDGKNFVSATNTYGLIWDLSLTLPCKQELYKHDFCSEYGSIYESYYNDPEKYQGVGKLVYLNDFLLLSYAHYVSVLWDGRTGKSIASLDTAIKCFALSQNTELFVTSNNNVIKIWNLNEITKQLFNKVIDNNSSKIKLSCWKTFEEHSGSIVSMTFSPDNQLLASGDKNGNIIIRSIHNGQLISPPLIGHIGSIHNLMFNETSNQLISISKDTSVKIWNLKDIQQTNLSSWNVGGLQCAVLDCNNQFIVSASRLTGINLWKSNNSRLKQINLSTSKNISALALTPNGKFLAFSTGENERKETSYKSFKDIFRRAGARAEVINRHSLGIIDIQRQKLTHFYLEAKTSINCIAFSPNGKFIALGDSSSKIKLSKFGEFEKLYNEYNNNSAETFEEIADEYPNEILEGHAQTVSTLAFSPDSKILISAGEDKQIYLWNVEGTNKYIGKLKGHPEWINQVCFSPDGKLIVSSCDKQLRFWDVENKLYFHKIHPDQYKNLLKIIEKPCKNRTMAFRGDGGVLAFSENTKVHFYSIKNYQSIEIYEGSDKIKSLQFSKNNTNLLIGSINSIIILYCANIAQYGYNYQVIMHFGISSLVLKDAVLFNVKNLSQNNLKLAKQLGSIETNNPAFRRIHKKMLTEDNESGEKNNNSLIEKSRSCIEAYYQNAFHSEKQFLSSTEISNESNQSSYNPQFFKQEQNAISPQKKIPKTSKNEQIENGKWDESNKNEKCSLM